MSLLQVCSNCGKSEDDQFLVNHNEDEMWCLDCMRRIGYCVSCDSYIPNLVDDYYEYEDDMCPSCVRNEEKSYKRKADTTISRMKNVVKSLHFFKSEKSGKYYRQRWYTKQHKGYPF